MFYKNIMLAILCSIIPCTTFTKTIKDEKKQTYYEYITETLSNNWKPIAIGTGVLTTAGIMYLVLQNQNTNTSHIPDQTNTLVESITKGYQDSLASVQNTIRTMIAKAPETGAEIKKSIHNAKEYIATFPITPINGVTPRERSLALENNIKDAYTSFVQKCKDALARKETQDNLNAVKTSILAGVDKVINTSKSFAHAAWGFTDNPKPSPVLEAARNKTIYTNLLKEAQTAQGLADQAWNKAAEWFKKL
ncbi:hypothetical protein EBQ93_04765 [bacterium]|nr:hypothetical protein [bacterium]